MLPPFDASSISVLSLAAGLVYLLGLLSVVDAVMSDRPPQSAMAWAVGLLAFPVLALPLYWVFGRARYREFSRAVRRIDEQTAAQTAAAHAGVRPFLVSGTDDPRGDRTAFEALATFPATRGNAARLLVDGEATFEAIFEAIRRAERYVLVQYYIFRDDALGERLRGLLEERLRAGARVYVLYDELGSARTSRRYWRALREAGAEVSPFPGARFSLVRRFLRINFRNHRKVVVVDGRVAFVGGINVGDEYLGGDPTLSPWRDTHLRIEGPAALGAQLSFVRDWTFCVGPDAGRDPALAWTAAASPEDRTVFLQSSGPHRPGQTADLLVAHAIHSAERRVWLATPYFVPNETALSALRLAALRGVDVRVLVPRRSDGVLVALGRQTYLAEVARAGIAVWLYEPGFMHQKAFVVDDDHAAVSTVNFDNRSFQLNFEITALVADRAFCGDVAAMFEDDFTRSSPLDVAEMERRPFYRRAAAQVARLFSPAH